eukprot:Amastigsp_a354960_5.p3 type:complete len:102 gc:universal Amastigsp_a354960_5:536-231(-)
MAERAQAALFDKSEPRRDRLHREPGRLRKSPLVGDDRQPRELNVERRDVAAKACDAHHPSAHHKARIRGLRGVIGSSQGVDDPGELESGHKSACRRRRVQP